MAVHETQIRVRYGETDQAGVVYYGAYLLYFEVGRTEFMRALGLPYAEVEKRGLYLTVADTYCKYLGAARYDDLLTIRTFVSKLTLTRVVFEYEVINESAGVVVARGYSTLACIDRGRKLTRMPDDVRNLLAQAQHS